MLSTEPETYMHVWRSSTVSAWAELLLLRATAGYQRRPAAETMVHVSHAVFAQPYTEEAWLSESIFYIPPNTLPLQANTQLEDKDPTPTYPNQYHTGQHEKRSYTFLPAP